MNDNLRLNFYIKLSEFVKTIQQTKLITHSYNLFLQTFVQLQLINI